jgi:hypothetical protein
MDRLDLHSPALQKFPGGVQARGARTWGRPPVPLPHAVALQIKIRKANFKSTFSFDRLWVMGLKGYRLWVMGQLDSKVQRPTAPTSAASAFAADA